MTMDSEAKLFHQRPAPVAGKLVPTPTGAMSYNVLGCLLSELGCIQKGVGVEVGVLEGVTSSYLLKIFSSLKLYCVDCYEDYSEFESNRTQQQMNEIEVRARARLANFGSRVEFIKKYSVEASKEFSIESLDFVFIDALHTFEAVKEDLHAWYPKVRKGGLVAGHDYSWEGVRKAVHEFVLINGICGFYSPEVSDLWYFVK